MEIKYGEYLFDATDGTILECFNVISREDVEAVCDYTIYMRGLEYFEEGNVEELRHNIANNTIEATVRGTSDYFLEFYLDDDGVYGTCSCPYDGVCKHLIAVMLRIVDNGTDNILKYSLKTPSTIESLDFLKEHLKTLSKENLITLVMKFAPPNFVTEVKNLKLPGKEAATILQKTENKIRNFFEDEGLLHDPDGMEKALMTQLNKLKGLEPHIANQIGDLILFIIESIGQAIDEGYLYIDNYYQEEYFESEDFCEFVSAFVRQLPYKKKIEYLIRLDQALNEMSYDTFSGIEESYPGFFSETERTDLKNFVLHNSDLPVSLVLRLYKLIEQVIDDKEKEALLLLTSKKDIEHLIALCRMLYEQNRFSEIKGLLISDSPYGNPLTEIRAAEIYLDTALNLNLNMDEESEKVLEKCPRADILIKIKNTKGIVGPRCENIVKNRNPKELLAFYEKENRMNDALALILQKIFFMTM